MNRSAAGSNTLTGFDWQAAGLFVFNLLASISLCVISLLSTLFVIFGGALNGVIATEDQQISSLMFSAGLAFAGILVLPIVYYSGRRLFGYPARPAGKMLAPGWGFLLLPVIIFLGHLSQTGPTWSKYALPLFHLLANGLGILWLLSIAGRKLSRGSALRYWSSFGSGLVLAPMIAFGVEILILVVIGILWFIMLQNQPGLKERYRCPNHQFAAILPYSRDGRGGI